METRHLPPTHIPPRHLPPKTLYPLRHLPPKLPPATITPRILHLHFNFNFNSMLSILCVFKKFYVIFRSRDHFLFEIVLCSFTR